MGYRVSTGSSVGHGYIVAKRCEIRPRFYWLL